MICTEYRSYSMQTTNTSKMYLENEISYYHNPGSRPLITMSVGQTLENSANIWPDRPFLISDFESRMMTFSQLHEETNKLASGLLGLGLVPGDRLGICSPNSINWFTLMMATAKIGVITVAINPANQIRELEYCLNKVGVKALAMPSKYKSQDYYGMLKQLIPDLESYKSGRIKNQRIPTLESLIMMDDQILGGAFRYSDVLNMDNTITYRDIQPLITPDSMFSILFTSGSTGLPKAAVQSHKAYLNSSFNGGFRYKLDERYHKICLQVPFFHAFSKLIALAALQHGSSLVMPTASFNPELGLTSIIQHQCSVLTGTPTMYVDMIKKQNEMNLPLKSPEIAVTGGAPCSPQLFSQMANKIGVNTLSSVYGMTEALSVFQSMPGEEFGRATDTVGKVLDHLEIKIVDMDGNVVPVGVAGELCIRAYSNMMGYWDDELKTAETIDADHWLKTGDQFVLKDDGYGKISGRIKDIIIRGGENIFPKEIEDFLNTHPDIIETHVFGVRDDRLGEEICASVRIKEGSMIDDKVVKNYCTGKIAHFKIPKYLKIVDEFPKTASGKIQKFKLKEMVENGTI